MAVHYSTDHIDPRERFDFWRSVICDAYLPINCDVPDHRNFDGSILLERLSKLTISNVCGSPQNVSRGASEIGRNADAFFMLSVQLSNSSKLTQAGRSTILHPGDFALYSTADPYEIQCETPVDQLVIQLPHDTLLTRVPQADVLTGLAVRAECEIGGLISTQMQQYARAIVNQPASVQSHLQDVMIDLVATGLSTLSQGRANVSRPEHLVLARAKSTILENLRNHDLDREFVARNIGMSARNLGRVFANQGLSISAFIRQCRLKAIAADLIDPCMVTLSISEISCKWGMMNFQHLSKLFKTTYGLSPRSYRQTRRTLQ